ncbi:hypothetical protein DFH08DRAFT_680719 [Mycena albidolilacea]|uniref:Uncharacterized protein n=1 Tax=Mycena albidolilacea TaxID=1033008 RepID=A0AAD7AN94_9AGAR|nr:hypothetical protein DFH08DRAFT_680719 [Mycena albidolilacea]
MSGKAKAKAKGISASSFLDLKAELSKQEDEFTRNKAAGKSNYIVGGVKRPDKKPTVWARHNKGVNARASHDIELEAISKPTLESARAALERKAKIYDKLKKGQTGGLNDKQYESLLVDFDSKPSDQYESDSDDVDESVEVARPLVDDDDPIVEYEDEFGRMRTARRSEVPRDLIRPTEPVVDEDEDLVIRNPVGHFPVYRPSADRVEQIEKEFAEANNPLGVHYDASAEVRARGAGFYQFSQDEETRKAQMEELKSARVETETTRKEMGALDVLPGETEGMQDSGAGGGKSRAMEKRKRELEERRKILDAKRRKLTTGKDNATAAEPHPAVFTATAEPVFTAVADDPFAALEVASKHKGKAKAQPVANDADKFLAQLEQEFMSGKRK